MKEKEKKEGEMFFFIVIIFGFEIQERFFNFFSVWLCLHLLLPLLLPPPPQTILLVFFAPGRVDSAKFSTMSLSNWK